MSEDVAFIRSIKTKEMRDLGVNDKTMNDWKNTCIQKILVSYPMIARGQLKFDDWDSAIKYLQENR